MRDALIQIVLRLRDDVLRDREIGSRNQPPARSENNNFFSSGSSNTGLALPSSFMSSVPQVASVDFDRRPETGSSMSMLPSSGGLYGYGSFPVTSPPSAQTRFISFFVFITHTHNLSLSDNRWAITVMDPSLLTHPIYMEGKLVSFLLLLYFQLFPLLIILCIHRLPQSTTMEVRIPANAVGKVMGRGGGNLDNIRRVCSKVFLIFLPHCSLITIASFVSSSLFPI